MESKSSNLRDIAIIAHVDHGKTTLVDQMLKQSGIFRLNESVAERVMDSNDLERERGITILSKNTSVMYDNVKINIVDTPGHADFGGEVERILMMVDGVLLLVDAFEGCMPQTRFVLQKALKLGKKPVVVINKIDRDGARPEEVIDEVLDLFIELGANDDQIEFPVVYASGRNGYAFLDKNDERKDLRPLFETIIKEVPSPKGKANAPLQLLISNIDFDDYVGRIGVGRIERGTLTSGQAAVICTPESEPKKVKIGKIYKFEGLKKVEASSASVGEIVSISGVPNINIGETLCSPEFAEALPFVKIDEPTVSMNFMVNNSPFAGREGKFITSRNVRERLFKEIETNVSMKVEETDSADTFKVSGRGELHLSILIETMRREGFEFQVSKPQVIMKKIDEQLCEPIEILSVEIPENYVGTVMEKIGSRKAELINMFPKDGGMTLLEFRVPSRGIIGYRSEFLTDTNGKGIINQIFDCYEPYKGEIIQRYHGSLVAHETGVSTGYGLFAAQERGKLFIGPGVEVYEGMVVGSTSKAEDITVNVCKKKHVTNMRAAGSDEALKLTPPTLLSLEQSIEFIDDDELLEVTPKSLRIRKKILDKTLRLRSKISK